MHEPRRYPLYCKSDGFSVSFTHNSTSAYLSSSIPHATFPCNIFGILENKTFNLQEAQDSRRSRRYQNTTRDRTLPRPSHGLGRVHSRFRGRVTPTTSGINASHSESATAHLKSFLKYTPYFANVEKMNLLDVGRPLWIPLSVRLP